MSPNFRRYLPFILIAFFILIAGQTLFKRHSSGGDDRAPGTLQTVGALNLIRTAEQAYRTKNGRFTSNVADLVPYGRHLTTDLADGIGMQVDVSTDGHRYLAQVVSDVLSLNRTVQGTKVIAQDCVIVKSGSGVDCPPPAH